MVGSTKNIQMRRKTGSMLIELMVAIVVAGLLAISLCQSLSQTKDASFGAHGRVLCASVSESISERLKSVSFDTLPTSAITIPIQVYSDVTVSPMTFPSIQQPALVMDTTNFIWSDKSLQDRLNLVSFVSFTPGPVNGTLLATITVTGADSRSSYSSSVLLTRYGVQAR